MDMQRVQRCCYDRAAQTIVAPTLVVLIILTRNRMLSLAMSMIATATALWEQLLGLPISIPIFFMQTLHVNLS